MTNGALDSLTYIITTNALFSIDDIISIKFSRIRNTEIAGMSNIVILSELLSTVHSGHYRQETHTGTRECKGKQGTQGTRRAGGGAKQHQQQQHAGGADGDNKV